MATVLLLVFPDGSLPSPRWRWIARLAVIAIVLTYVSALFAPETAGWSRPTVVNPMANEVIGDLDLIAVPPLFGCVIASVVAVVRRYRRAAGASRLQLKWLAASGVGAVVVWILAIFVVEWQATEDAAVVVSVLGFTVIPVGIGVAVLRYRLFEIDRLVSRTVTYAVLVVVLAGVYTGGVLGLRSLLPRQSDAVVAASTLAVAALFAPLRRRVQRTVDRRFNRSRFDGEQALERFTARMRDELDLDDLSDDVLAVVTTTVQPVSASLWIAEEGQ